MKFGPLDLLLACIPIAIVLELLHVPAGWVFVTSSLAIIALAAWMGRATEHLASHYGAGVGGLLNASFGNAAELIIALFALGAGLHEVVKASITGSIIGNSLLVLGLSLFAGGLRHKKQTFNRTAAGVSSTLLAICAVGLVVPGIFHAVGENVTVAGEHRLSVIISVILFMTYGASLLFALRTHKHVYTGDDAQHHAPEDLWSKRRALVVLVVAAGVIAVMAEFLVGSVAHTAEVWGMSNVFVGVILVAIVGNAAEHSTAVLVALRNRMDLSLGIACGSSAQIALFVAPVLVFASYVIGPGPMDLLFTPLEIIAVVFSVFVVTMVAHDGESNWLEGLMLIAVYAILACGFWFA